MPKSEQPKITESRKAQVREPLAPSAIINPSLLGRRIEGRALLEIQSATPEVLVELQGILPSLASPQALEDLKQWAESFGLLKKNGDLPEWLQNCATNTLRYWALQMESEARKKVPSNRSSVDLTQWLLANGEPVTWHVAQDDLEALVLRRVPLAPPEKQTGDFPRTLDGSIEFKPDGEVVVRRPRRLAYEVNIGKVYYDPEKQRRESAYPLLEAEVINRLKSGMDRVEAEMKERWKLIDVKAKSADHFKWLVLNRVRRKSFEDIAQLMNVERDTVRLKVTALADALGINRPIGRPRKRA